MTAYGTYLIAGINILASISFFAGFILAFRLYQATKEMSAYWLLLSYALFLAGTWTAGLAAEWLRFYPTLMDAVSPHLFVAIATAFTAASLFASTSFVQPAN